MVAKTTADKISDAVQGEDKPIDEKRPSLPFAMVAAYPIILVVALLAILAYFMIVHWK